MARSGPILFHKIGDVAQLEEHLVRNEGVASSTLVISTILLRSKLFLLRRATFVHGFVGQVSFELRRNCSEAECPYEAIPEF